MTALPVSSDEFAGLMEVFSPFETRPLVAVAVSGGADSLALALLAADWARAQGGSATGVTVDHRLRPESGDEATRVASWLARHGVAHATLVRDGAPLSGDAQAAARAARYRLLEAWCAASGVLHLLTAHHREDQAETLLLRLARGSGLDGLAGMSALVERAQCRICRPVLGLPRARLAATLAARGQDWIEDPSNQNPAYARVRLRQAEAVLAAEGLGPERLADTALHLGRARQALEPMAARLLARAVWLHPAGFAWLDAVRLAASPAEVRLRALGAVIACIGGADYPPRLSGLERLDRELANGLLAARTLGGCLVLPRRGRVLVCREPEAVAAPVAVSDAARAPWDGRFLAQMPDDGGEIGALGVDAADNGGPLDATIPPAARATLPTLRHCGCVITAPLLLYPHPLTGRETSPYVRFRPCRPLTGAGFALGPG
jgi:tRNA(Ile)-lysidine synthase